jgi:alpha-beta hydrolase superfamily lysophospholipase
MVELTEIRLRTADGLGLFAREWRPKGKVKGVVCVLHGLGEHGGQYVEVAEAFVAAGIAFIAIDLRGHGRSDGKRGHTPSHDALLDDVDAMLAGAAERHPGVPRFLYGHSLGGNVVLNHALRRQPQITGVIATGPWLRLTDDLVWYKRIPATILEPFLPTLSFSTTTDRDEILEEVGVRRNAELFHNLITIRLLIRTRRAGIWAAKHGGLLSVPTLVIHGERDPVADPKASLDFARGAGPLCTVVLQPEVGHNPHEEDASTIPTMVGWVLGRIAQA